jgi:hypothetical protein
VWISTVECGDPGAIRKEKWPPVAQGPKELAPYRWRTEGSGCVGRVGRIGGRDRLGSIALKGSNGGRFPDGGARSLVWLEHPADNREVAGSNPAGPTSRQRIAPFSKCRLPLRRGGKGFHSLPDMGVENRKSLGHLALPHPHVVEGLVDRDVAEDSLDGRYRHSWVVGEPPEGC